MFGLLSKKEVEKLVAKSKSDLHEDFKIQWDRREREIEDKIRKMTIEHEDALRNLKNDYEQRRVRESLELQTKTAQQILDAKKELNEKIHALEMEKVNFKAQMESDFYNKMKDAMNDLHTKGNSTTNFVQEMALKMLDVKRDLVQIENKVG